jgi:hypothetical protein
VNDGGEAQHFILRTELAEFTPLIFAFDFAALLNAVTSIVVNFGTSNKNEK